MPAIKFYQSGKERLVWDPEKGKTVAEFLGGEFETDDKSVQDHLLKLGYQPMAKAEAAFQTAAIDRPLSKQAVPSSEAGGAVSEVDPTEVKPRRKTSFEPNQPEEAQRSGSGPRPAPARAKRNSRVQE